MFDEKLKQAKLATNKDQMEKLQTFDLSFFIGKSYFSYDESQNYLIFEPVYNTFIRLTCTETIIA